VKCIAYTILGRKREGEIPHRRPRRGWKDDIKMDLKEMGYDVDWINLARDRTSGGL
jgi:hypothetical protein